MTTSITVLNSSGTSQSLATDTDSSGLQSYHFSGDSSVPHYGFAYYRNAVTSTPTVVLSLAGSATKTVRVKRLVLSGVATAAGVMPFVVQMGAIPTGGGGGLQTSISFDSQNPTATTNVRLYGGTNPTSSLSVGIYSGELQLAATGTGVPGVVDLQFGTNGTQAPVLRGTSTCLQVNFQAVTAPAGALFDFTVWWSEDNS